MNLFDRVIGRLRGSTLAVLGERETGKTHLQTFLREGRIPTTYAQTLTQDKVGAGRARLYALETLDGAARPVQKKLALKPGYDVPGSAEAAEAWREVADAANIILYLFRCDWVYGGNRGHVDRIREDAAFLAQVISDARTEGTIRSNTRCALVGTHFDLVPGYRGPAEGSKFYRWHNMMEESPDVTAARWRLEVALADLPALVVGSMKTLQDTQELAFRLFVREMKM